MPLVSVGGVVKLIWLAAPRPVPAKFTVAPAVRVRLAALRTTVLAAFELKVELPLLTRTAPSVSVEAPPPPTYVNVPPLSVKPAVSPMRLGRLPAAESSTRRVPPGFTVRLGELRMA